MNEIVMLKSERKMLRKMRSRDYKKSEIQHFRSLRNAGMISPRMSDAPDEHGVTRPIDSYYLTDAYWRYVESHRWFTSEYVVSHLLIPIASAAIGGLLTALLCGLL